MATRPAAEEKPWELAAHPRLPKGRTVAVVVLDGWGEAAPDPFNCIHVADTPTLDALKKVRYVTYTAWRSLNSALTCGRQLRRDGGSSRRTGRRWGCRRTTTWGTARSATMRSERDRYTRRGN
jgi:hypothetical protein